MGDGTEVKRVRSKLDYYGNDTEQRKNYFDKQFLSHAQKFAESKGFPLSAFLSTIVDYNSFVKALELAWGDDPSLMSYLDAMKKYNDLPEFFGRSTIQNIVEKNSKDEYIVVKQIPVQVKQIKKRTRLYYEGEIKGKSVIVTKHYERDKNGKRRIVYKDSKGRYAKYIGATDG